MAKVVREIMNPELFSLRPSDSAEDALGYIRALGITAAPVVAADQTTLGVVSWRDLIGARSRRPLTELMSQPVVTVKEDTEIEEVARVLARTGVHRAIVIDDDEHAKGVVSALDVIRGLLGEPAVHPNAFPHYDGKLGVTWSDDAPLELEQVDLAPDGPGVFVLIEGGRNRPEVPVWVESATNVRTRLFELLSHLPTESPHVRRMLSDLASVRFRATSVPNLERRNATAQAILSQIANLRLPKNLQRDAEITRSTH